MTNSIELPGLDGSNLLAYFAALGTLCILSRVAARRDNEVRMSWNDQRGYWMPWVHHSHISSGEELIEALAAELCGDARVQNPAFGLRNDLVIETSVFGAMADEAARAATVAEREWVDYLAAFGSDGCLAKGTKASVIDDTALRTMSGAGHQHFLGFMLQLIDLTVADDLRRTLMQVWDYADDGPSMRWDPCDYRPHALRADDPSGDPIHTMRGANRLAIEALPLFAGMPTERGFMTTSFGNDNAVSGPVWTSALTIDCVRSLLALADTAGRGLGQVFHWHRFTEGKYRNFSPAQEML